MRDNNGFDEKILRDYLAIDRTKLANQRTILAYIRTFLILLGTGVTLLKLFSFKETLFYVGAFCAIFSIVFLFVGIVSYKKVARNISLLYNKINMEKEKNV